MKKRTRGNRGKSQEQIITRLSEISRYEPLNDENTDVPPFTTGWVVFEESDASDHNDPMGTLKDMLKYSIDGRYGGLVQWVDQGGRDGLASPIYKVEGRDRIPTNPNHVIRAIYKHPHTISGWKPRVWVAPGASIPLIILKIEQGYKIECSEDTDKKKIFDIPDPAPALEPEPEPEFVPQIRNPKVTQLKSTPPLIRTSRVSGDVHRSIKNVILPRGSSRKKKKKKTNKKKIKKKKKTKKKKGEKNVIV